MPNSLLLVAASALVSVQSAVADFPPIPEPDDQYVVRIAYVVPKNREPRQAVIKNLQHLMKWQQGWYAEQMDRHGYGRKTFRFENGDRLPPPVHLVRLSQPDSDFHVKDEPQGAEHAAAWKKLINAVKEAGVPLGERGQVWLLATELHKQLPDGSVVGRLNRGGPYRNRHSGVATGATTLFGMADEFGMTNADEYDGMTIPEVGPYPLRHGSSFKTWRGGRTLGGVVSGDVGGMMHEVLHGFGVKHNKRNETTPYHGYMMGPGYRGVRSEMYSRRFPGEAVNLSAASAAVLNVNRHFNSDREYTDDTPPVIRSVRVETRPVDGHLVAKVEASDDQQLAYVTFHLNSYVDDDRALNGTDQKLTLKSWRYKSGTKSTWDVRVLDAQGNIAVKTGTITISDAEPHAPIPVIWAHDYTIKTGQETVVDASRSRDPDSGNLLVEWDTNGDGEFDSVPNSRQQMTIKFAKSGVYRVVARVSDESHKSTSAPILIRVTD